MLRPADIGVVAPPDAFIDLAIAKAWLRVDHSEDDVLIGLQIEAACAHIDGPLGQTGRAIGGGTYDFRYDGALAGMRLGFRLHGRLTGAISANGDEVAASAATLVTYLHGEPYLKAEAAWITDNTCSLQATFGAADLPHAKAAALAMVGQMYRFREESITERVSENPQVVRAMRALKTGWIA